ncbi:unnamed protein product, partial [Discosporangium mesarthrocarpum]
MAENEQKASPLVALSMIPPGSGDHTIESITQPLKASKSPLLLRKVRGANEVADLSQVLDQIPELCISSEEDVALDELLKEAEAKGGPGLEALPVEWVVDIADESNEWFVATAYSYNDEGQYVHVMVPDRVSPVWEGDIPLNSLLVHLLECCDARSSSLFKQLVRESAMEVDWRVRVRVPKKPNSSTDIGSMPAGESIAGPQVAARATVFLPLGSVAVIVDEE